MFILRATIHVKRDGLGYRVVVVLLLFGRFHRALLRVGLFLPAHASYIEGMP